MIFPFFSLFFFPLHPVGRVDSRGSRGLVIDKTRNEIVEFFFLSLSLFLFAEREGGASAGNSAPRETRGNTGRRQVAENRPEARGKNSSGVIFERFISVLFQRRSARCGILD